ncbi:MAG TPA: hypothetical protein VK427_03090 [Kofleriaceae bacterium]|nr:hypothetical protein [Kofleriaceae bacterium]
MKLAIALALTLAASAAHADSKSWSAVKNQLPDNVNVVVGVDVSALRGTAIYRAVVPHVISREPDAREALELLKSTCAIDPHSAIADATVAMGDDERGVVVAALDKSIDQKRFLDCMTKLVARKAKPDSTTGPRKAGAKKPAAKPAPKVIAKTTGKVTEYGVDGESKRLFVAWLAADVVAVATDPDDKALLERMLAGKGARGAIGSYLAKVSPNAMVWLATTKPQPIQMGGTMKGAYGTLDEAKGNFSTDLSIVMASAKEAKAFVEQATQLIASTKSAIPPQFVKLVEAVKLSSAADAANLKVVASEQDVLGLISLVLMR